MRVKIFGAGSIGNHMAYAFRTKGFEVHVCDNDIEALTRMEMNIYPERYGKWDSKIKLYESSNAPIGGFDIIIIGTPPESHLDIARCRGGVPRDLARLQAPCGGAAGCQAGSSGAKSFDPGRRGCAS